MFKVSFFKNLNQVKPGKRKLSGKYKSEVVSAENAEAAVFQVGAYGVSNRIQSSELIQVGSTDYLFNVQPEYGADWVWALVTEV